MTLTDRCLHCPSPRHLSAQLTRAAEIYFLRRLRLSAADDLPVRPMPLVTVGDRAFSVAAARRRNELPGDVAASMEGSLAASRR